MKYNLIDVRLCKAQRTNNEFITATAVNPTNIRGSKPTYTEFDPTVVAMYKEHMVPSPNPQEAAKGIMVVNPANPLPEELATLPQAFLVQVQLPCVCNRIYTRQFVDALGTIHNPGEVVTTKDGTPKPYTEVTVLCLKETDNETQESRWVEGKEPYNMMLQQFSTMFKPATEPAVPVPQMQMPQQQAQAPAQVQVQGIEQANVVGQQQAQQVAGGVTLPQTGVPVGAQPNPNEPAF